MQDELKKVISESMDTNSEFEQKPSEQIAEGELSDEALESVAGGRFGKYCIGWTFYWNGNKKV